MDQSELFRKFVDFTTAVHQVKHKLTRDIKLDAVTPVQYGILEYVAVSQPVTLSDISDCQQLSMPNASRELKKLTELGLCEKFAAADDRRKQYVRLSAKGQAMMDEAFGRVEVRFKERIRGVADEELEEIARALELLRSKVFDPGRRSDG